MATKTFFLTDAAVNGFGTLSETDPGASTMGTGWTVAKLAAGNFSPLLYDSEQASGTFSTTDYLVTTHPNPQNGDCWRSADPLNGVFANANWSFTFAVRAVTGAGAQRGRVKARVWKSANADGSSPTELTAATLTGGIIAGISTTVDNTSTITWSPGSTLSFVGEYLFVQCEWEITTAGDNNNRDILHRASASTIVTSDFTATVYPFVQNQWVMAPPPPKPLYLETGLQQLPVVEPVRWGRELELEGVRAGRFNAALLPFGAGARAPEAQALAWWGGALPADPARRLLPYQEFAADVLGPLESVAPPVAQPVQGTRQDSISFRRRARILAD